MLRANPHNVFEKNEAQRCPIPNSRTVNQLPTDSNPGPSNFKAHKPEWPKGTLLAPLMTPERYGAELWWWCVGGWLERVEAGGRGACSLVSKVEPAHK